MKNLLILFLRFFIIFAQIKYGYSKCQKACTNAFKNSIVSIIGHSGETETELLAPFHSVIVKSRTTAVATRKISWICFAVSKFEQCSRKCPSSNDKSMRMASVIQWNTICNASRESPTAFNEFIQCERHHIDKTMKKCPLIKVEDKMSLKDFCKKLQEYTECYIGVPFECSIHASDLWLKINNSIQQSFNFLLQLSSQHLKLPPECQESMATTLPMGILTTLSPSPSPPQLIGGSMPMLLQPKSLSSPTTASSKMPTSTLSSLYQIPDSSESSVSDDYSYFQQTDDYKYFGKDRGKTTTSIPLTVPTNLPKIFDESLEDNGLDYWIDLEEDSKQQKYQNDKTNSERRLSVTKQTMTLEQSERASIRRTTSAWRPMSITISTIKVSAAANSLNSGSNFAIFEFFWHLWVFAWLIIIHFHRLY